MDGLGKQLEEVVVLPACPEASSELAEDAAVLLDVLLGLDAQFPVDGPLRKVDLQAGRGGDAALEWVAFHALHADLL